MRVASVDALLVSAHHLQDTARLAVFDRISIHRRREGLLDLWAGFHESLALPEDDTRLVHVAGQAKNSAPGSLSRNRSTSATPAASDSCRSSARSPRSMWGPSPAIRTQPAEQRLDDVAPLPAGQREGLPGLPALAVIQRVLEEATTSAARCFPSDDAEDARFPGLWFVVVMPCCYCLRCSCHRVSPSSRSQRRIASSRLIPISSFCPASMSRQTSPSACRYTRLSRPVACRWATASSQNSRPAAPTSAGHSPSPDTFCAFSFRLARSVATLPTFGPLLHLFNPYHPGELVHMPSARRVAPRRLVAQLLEVPLPPTCRTRPHPRPGR